MKHDFTCGRVKVDLRNLFLNDNSDIRSCINLVFSESEYSLNQRLPDSNSVRVFECKLTTLYRELSTADR